MDSNVQRSVDKHLQQYATYKNDVIRTDKSFKFEFVVMHPHTKLRKL